MTQLYKIKVKLSDDQKKDLIFAYLNRVSIFLRLEEDSLFGNDTLYVPHNIFEQLEENRKLKKGMDIEITEIKDILKQGFNDFLMKGDGLFPSKENKIRGNSSNAPLLPHYTLKRVCVFLYHVKT